MINLLTETEKILKENDFTWNSVKFISNAEGYVEIATFIEHAKNFYYENNLSEGVVVDPTLVIGGSYWWISRVVSVADNEERWLYHKKPKKPEICSNEFSLTTKRPISKILKI